MSGGAEERADVLYKGCPTCGDRVETWARICPRCEYEWPVTQDEVTDLQLVEFKEHLKHLTPRLWVTPLLIGVNVVVFVAMVAMGAHILAPTPESLVGWGANFGPLVMSGQEWRLFTSTFLHVGILHLLFNMFVLWNIGSLVERIVGNESFLILYLLSGISGSLVSTAWHPLIVSAGASGAIFGLFGVLLGFLLRHRDTVPQDALRSLQKSVLVFLGYNLLFGLRPGIDMAAHLGGLLGGFTFGWFAVQPLTLAGVKGRRRSILWVGLSASVVILGAIALLSHL